MTLIAGRWDIWLGNENTFSTLWMMGEKIQTNKSGGNVIFITLDSN